MIEFGDCRDIMKRWTAEGVKVQTCITSPPYYGLRDYGTATWIGGDTSCEHEGVSMGNNRNFIDEGGRGSNKKSISYGNCIKCGAIREDKQIGLEETIDGYVKSIVEVFAHVHNLLTDDGTLWVNLGDSYAGSNGNGSVAQTFGQDKFVAFKSPTSGNNSGIRPKNLIGIPWRVAFALQEFGWYLRQDIIWSKPNPMPESVKDRCTKSHEYIFLLSKKPHYYFDNEAIKEPVKEDWGTRDRTDGKYHNEGTGLQPHSGLTKSYEMANKRSVWTVNTKPYKGAHFAVFPNELIEPMVLASTKPNDIVLDPFMGSGTTAEVAQHLNRQYMGCELNPDYKDLQFKRLRQQSLELL